MKSPYSTTGPLPLPKLGSWPESVHEFDEASVYALMAAEAAGRPLLVRGEPGTGKSQLARAAAVASGRLFLSVVVNARTECQDLQWQFDAVARLGEAQVLAAGHDGDRLARLNPVHFLSPGPLWWALDFGSAHDQRNRCHSPPDPVPELPPAWQPGKGSVVLIDEIDKADTDLPNSLLETLGNGDFSVPYLGDSVRRSGEAPSPLVIITTNEDRELPAAFLRRCLVLSLSLPEPLDDFLCRRGKAHFGGRCAASVREAAARLLVEDRRAALDRGWPPPGQAEYLDLLRAVAGMADDEAGQLSLLERLRRFVLRKTPVEPASPCATGTGPD
jgi:MoxR-like ATPase